MPNANWLVAAGAVNAIWGELFPRLVAKQWQDQIGNPAAPDLVKNGSEKQTLAAAANALLGRSAAPFSASGGLVAGVHPRMAARMALGKTWSAKDRIDLALDGFTGACSPPFRVAFGGGFDFLVSDWGFEFLFPDKPADVTALVRFYSYRNTGRPAIGLPLYLGGPCTALSTDTPSGASQATVPTEWLQSALSSISLPEGLRSILEGMVEDRHATPFVPFGTYRCLQAQARRWQIQGSVYRAIMTELPRLVALAWLESLDGVGSRHYSPGFFGDGTGSPKPSPLDGLPMLTGTNDYLRTLFCERLETSLPGPDAMDFGIVPRDVAGGERWDPDDVMITEKGFYFPQPEDIRQVSLDGLLGEIANGRAGNPVFTNSARSGT